MAICRLHGWTSKLDINPRASAVVIIAKPHLPQIEGMIVPYNNTCCKPTTEVANYLVVKDVKYALFNIEFHRVKQNRSLLSFLFERFNHFDCSEKKKQLFFLSAAAALFGVRVFRFPSSRTSFNFPSRCIGIAP